EQRMCGRCRGIADAGAQFCKFCGASLVDGTSVPPQANGRPAPIPSPVAAPIPSPSPIGGPIAKYGPPPAVAPAASHAPAPVVAAPAAKRGRITVIAKSGADGQSYPIGDQFDVGRLEGSVVVGEDP